MSTIQEKIDELQGTCNSIDMDEWTFEELEVLDEQIFQCDTCSWWFEVGEMSEDSNVCNDCNE